MITFSSYTNESNERRYTVLWKGVPLIADTADYQKAKEFFDDHVNHYKDAPVAMWDGDTMTGTVFDPKTGIIKPLPLNE